MYYLIVIKEPRLALNFQSSYLFPSLRVEITGKQHNQINKILKEK